MPGREEQRLTARRALFAELRRAGARRWVRVQGPSMRPLIESGSWVMVEFGTAPLAVGDVAVADIGPRLVVHRVIALPGGREGKQLVLKGDAEVRGDPRLTLADVFGVVRAVRGSDGHVTTIGCTGALSRAIALMSRAASRTAPSVLRVGAALPRPLARSFVRAALAVSSSPVFVLAGVGLVLQALDRRANAKASSGRTRSVRRPRADER